MIQLVFDAATPARGAAALAAVQVGYSQHEGAERAAWDDAKLERVGGTHPVVHPAAGSHANFYDEALYLGRVGVPGRRLRRHPGADDPTSVRGRGRSRAIPPRPPRRSPGSASRPLGRAASGVLQRPEGRT